MYIYMCVYIYIYMCKYIICNIGSAHGPLSKVNLFKVLRCHPQARFWQPCSDGFLLKNLMTLSRISNHSEPPKVSNAQA